MLEGHLSLHFLYSSRWKQTNCCWFCEAAVWFTAWRDSHHADDWNYTMWHWIPRIYNISKCINPQCYNQTSAVNTQGLRADMSSFGIWLLNPHMQWVQGWQQTKCCHVSSKWVESCMLHMWCKALSHKNKRKRWNNDEEWATPCSRHKENWELTEIQ